MSIWKRRNSRKRQRRGRRAIASGAEQLESRLLFAADPIHVGVVYLETDYLETDQDVGSDSQPDRFILSFTGGADDTELSELRIRTDKDGDGISVGDPIYDTESGGRGKNGFHGFEVVRVQAAQGNVTATAEVEDGGQELVIRLRGFRSGDRLEFTLDVDEVLRNSPDLAIFNDRLDVITSGQEFQDSILEATFEAPHFESAQAQGIFINDFGDPASTLGLDLPPDEGTDIDSRPNRSAAAVGSTNQQPLPVSIAGTVWVDDNLDLVRQNGETLLPGVRIGLERLNETTQQFESTGLETVTDAQGRYEFGVNLGLSPGTYRVSQVEQPSGFFSVGAVPGDLLFQNQLFDAAVGSVLDPNTLTDILIPEGNLHGVDFDFAEARPASLSGFVYEDYDNDGNRDAGELGIGSVPIRLVPISTIGPQTVLTTVTATDGSYRFDGISPGEYRVEEVEQPQPYVDGLDTAGTVSGILVGVAINPGDQIQQIALQGNQSGVEYNFGELPLGSLSGRVHLAAPGEDCFGSTPGNETPLPGVRVQLLDDTGQIVRTTTTDADGRYRFDQLPPGSYSIIEETPPELLNGDANPGTVTTPLGVITLTGVAEGGDLIRTIELTPGGEGVQYDFCEAAPAEVSGHVYVDANDDGVRQSEEAPIANVPVTLYDDRGQVVATTTTDAAGRYRFENLVPGTYQIREQQPDGYFDGIDAAGTVAGVTVGTALNPGDAIEGVRLLQGQSGVNYDFGERLPSSLTGRVFIDVDQDCIQDAGEVGLAGVRIDLLDDSGTIVRTTTTAADGTYRFDNLPAGQYSIRETQPAGLFHGGQMAGTGGGDDSQADLITRVNVGWGNGWEEYNFCEIEPSSLSGLVYVDQNGNCLVDPEDRGLSGVRVQLIAADGSVLQETRTNADGTYTFDDLAPGNYTVREFQPDGYFHGGQTAGSAGGNDSVDDLISQIQVGPGQTLIDYDFCELEPSSLSGLVYVDQNGNCVFEPEDRGLSGVIVELLAMDGSILQQTTTDASGAYSFDNLAPGEYSVREIQPDGFFHGGQTAGSAGGNDSIADLISQVEVGPGQTLTDYDFCELPPSSIAGSVFVDTDGDCVRDPQEQAISGVRVDLLDAAGQIITSTTTGADGTYRFEGLRPGTYSVREIQPAGLFHGGQTAGTGGGDDSVADLISQIQIGPGQSLTDYDFCEEPPSSISGSVFIDSDGDCRFDPTERPIEGVRVDLQSAGGQFITSTRTDATGNYRFDNLPAGEYRVFEHQPDGWYQGGEAVGSGGGSILGDDLIGNIPLGPGQDLVNYDFCELPGATLSGSVWQDDDLDRVFDPGERPLGNVQIDLLGPGGQTWQTTTTPDGGYRFVDLPPGVYQVRESQPDGFFHGGQIVGSEGGTIGGDDFITEVELLGGRDAINYDFPEIPPATISGFVFQDGPPLNLSEPPNPEDLRQFRDGVRSPGDAAIPLVTLELRTVLGQPFPTDRALPGIYQGESIQVQSDASGYYEFIGLRPGSYHVYQVQPDGFYDSLDTAGSTGGVAVNQADLPDPADQFVIQTLSASDATNPRDDAILNISLNAGQTSQNNNFSEITIEPGSVPPRDPPSPIQQIIVETPAPLPPPVRLVNYSTLDLYRRPDPRLFEPPVTWHLSVINAGFPRGTDATAAGDGGARVLQVGHRSRMRIVDEEFANEDYNQGEWRAFDSDGQPTDVGSVFVMGRQGMLPLIGDFNGDGFDEIGLFDNGVWYVDLNGNGRWDEGDLWLQLGGPDDRPVVGDWDGDGKDDIGIFGKQWLRDPEAISRDPGLPDPDNSRRRSPKNPPPEEKDATSGRRYLRRTQEGELRSDVIDHVFKYGKHADHPLAGDWNGDGVDSIAVFRTGQWILDSDGDGRMSTRDDSAIFGEPGDLPVVGDWDGDGIDELGVVRGNTWILDTDGDRRITGNDKRIEITGGDQQSPVAGDWDGDGKDEPGQYRAAG